MDGVVLPRQLIDVFDRGDQAQVPVLAGFNSGEIRSLRMLAPATPASAGEYERLIRDRCGDLTAEFLRLYPSADIYESILAVSRDALCGWTSERLVRSQTAAGKPSFLYLFDHGYPAADTAGLHAFHASELPYMFGALKRTPPRWPAIPNTPVETRLADAMVAYWTSFVEDGTPEDSGAAAWRPYADGEAYLAFREEPAAATALMPGMFSRHETAVQRRRSAGDQPWNWTTFLASPKLSQPDL